MQGANDRSKLVYLLAENSGALLDLFACELGFAPRILGLRAGAFRDYAEFFLRHAAAFSSSARPFVILSFGLGVLSAMFRLSPRMFGLYAVSFRIAMVIRFRHSA